MTSAGRGVRAGALALLSAAWALAAHRWAAGPAHDVGPSLVPLLWSGTATGLLAWWLLPLSRRPGRRWGALAGLLLLGQLLGHAALSLAPLLTTPAAAGGSGPHGPAPTGGPPHHPAVATGAPLTGDQVVAALGHTPGPMLVAHLVASIGAALAWTLGGMLWRATLRWLSGILTPPAAVRPLLPRPVPCPVTRAPRTPYVLSWDGRAPPLPA